MMLQKEMVERVEQYEQIIGNKASQRAQEGKYADLSVN